MKIVDVGAMWGYAVARIFEPWGVEIYEPKHVEDFKDTLDGINADLVMFGGGADINPEIYGHMNLASGTNVNSQIRDSVEESMWAEARKRNIPIMGICRGAQFICAKAGGKLLQDVNNHGTNHSIITSDGRVLEMTSTHHQMMFPFTIKHEVLAWTPRRSTRYVYAGKDFNESMMEREPEIVYFPDSNALGVQGHPEYFRDKNHPTIMYIRNIVKQHLLKRKFS